MAACAVAALLWFVAPVHLLAQAGSLDTNFNPGTGADGTVRAAVVQPDGKIIIGGDFTSVNGVAHNYIARLNADGSLDADFNAAVDNTVSALVLQPDGQILLGGSFQTVDGDTEPCIARLNADGGVTGNGFNPGLGANNTVQSIALQSDGGIVIAGDFTSVEGVTRNRLARLNPGGSLDTTFAPNGGADSEIRAVALISSSVGTETEMMIGGRFLNYNGESHTRLARVHSNGSLDHSFNPGTGANSTVVSFVVQTDGRIVFGGSFSSYNGSSVSCLARVDNAGNFDNDFNPGTGVNGSVECMASQANGQIVVGGFFSLINGSARSHVARFNGTGSLDTSFDPGSAANDTVRALALQGDGKTIAGGDFTASAASYNHILRLYGDAVPTPTPSPTPATPTPTPVPVPVITASADATAVVGASFSFAITATNSPTSFAAVGLPPGLSLDPVSGLIAGTPTTAGVYTVNVSATNASGTGTAALTITVTVPPANIGAVNILSPPTNINIVIGETIDLEVSIESVNGTLANVDYGVYDAVNTALIMSLGDTKAPRDHRTWMPATLGDFTLRVTATDTAGNAVPSDIPIHVITSPSNAPTSTLLSGLDGKSFAAGTSVPLVALATDANGNPLSNVNFYLDGVLQSGASASMASAVGRGPRRQDAAGSPFAQASAKMGNLLRDALLTVTGTDSHGVTSVSNPATIHVTAATAAFSCALTSPAGSGTYAPGASVTATATALETGGSVAQVEYFLNDQTVGVATAAPYAVSFALPASAAGQYALTAIATDTTGVSSASAPVVVTAATSSPAPTPPPTPTLPVMTVTGSPSVEEGSKGKIVFQRTGDTRKTITVRYKVAGDAEAGTDYKPLGSTVMIPAGETQAKVKLRTIDNTAVDGTRVVRIKLLPAPDGSYTVGDPATAKLKIIDND